jgi:Ca2+-binding EF-hand superfamily protein
MDMSEAEALILFNRFDASKDGLIDYNEFLRIVRGETSPSRKLWAQRVFSKLNRNSNGIVEVDDIREVYNAKQHTEVQMGRKTEEEVLGEFLDTFEPHHSLS